MMQKFVNKEEHVGSKNEWKVQEWISSSFLEVSTSCLLSANQMSSTDEIFAFLGYYTALIGN
jgi:hypothetical protein